LGLGKFAINRGTISDVALDYFGWFGTVPWMVEVKHRRGVERFIFFGSEAHQLNSAAPVFRAIKQWVQP
jgi:hypothetical protein